MFCTVNGIRLYYEVCGSGTPIILVHGNGESHEIFDVLIPQLSRTHTVYAVDSRCHGRSSCTDQLSYDLMAADLIGLIHSLKLVKTAFYGFSDGGILGLLIAMQQPRLLGKLIVSGANLNPGGLTFGSRLTIRLVAREPHINPADLGRITVPTVVLAGERDVIRRRHTEQIAAAIPGSVLEIIPGEAHGSYIVHSEKLYPILKKYM